MKMTVLRVELLDPRVRALLEDLVQLNLIKIQEEEDPSKRFSELLSRFRSREGEVPSIEEITAEVELIRAKRIESNNG